MKRNFLQIQYPIFLVIFLFLFPAITWSTEFSGKVVGVTDGDSLTVLIEQTPIKVRLEGIDCPEKKQPFGTKARDFVSDLAFGKVVKVKTVKKDKYGRTLGLVILPDGKILNQEIVKAGMGWHYATLSKDKTLAALERQARDNKVGLWVDKTPVPPWEWRKKKGATK